MRYAVVETSEGVAQSCHVFATRDEALDFGADLGNDFETDRSRKQLRAELDEDEYYEEGDWVVSVCPVRSVKGRRRHEDATR